MLFPFSAMSTEADGDPIQGLLNDTGKNNFDLKLNLLVLKLTSH